VTRLVVGHRCHPARPWSCRWVEPPPASSDIPFPRFVQDRARVGGVPTEENQGLAVDIESQSSHRQLGRTRL
jgi:hypothetical protein